MEVRIMNFLENATAVQLKEKLEALGHLTSGNKAAVRLRLEEIIKRMTKEQLEEHFPRNLILPVEESTDDLPTSGTQNSNFLPATENSVEILTDSQQRIGNHLNATAENENLDMELEILRERFKKKQEILELRRKLSELENTDETTLSKPHFHFRDIEESIPVFSGEDNYSIQKWLQQFEETAELLGWDQRTRFIYARRLLTGTAKLFLRTTSIKSWCDLRQVLIKEFHKNISSAEVHKELRKRRKKPEETYQQYVFSMLEIATQSDIEEVDIIYYIISGINDSPFNKTILYGANKIEELKDELQKYEKIKHVKITILGENTLHQKSSTNLPSRLNVLIAINMVTEVKIVPNPDEIEDPVSVAEKPHKINNCSQQPTIMMCTKTQSEETRKENLQQHEKSMFLNNKFEFNIKYAFGKDDAEMSFVCILPTLLDSGSPISFIQQQYLPSYLKSSIELDEYSFFGINNSQLKILGATNAKVYFRNLNIMIQIFVVDSNIMRYTIILGRNFMEKINLKLFVKRNLPEWESIESEEKKSSDDRRLQCETSDIHANNKGMSQVFFR